MSNTRIHIVVEAGEDAGKEITVPDAGARLGRSSKNDIVLIDPKLSRHHCRLEMRPGDGLWISDLNSANETIVNDSPVVEKAIHKGDRIRVGDTLLIVTDDGRPDTPVDLGLGGPPIIPTTMRWPSGIIIGLLIAVVAIVIGGIGWKIIRKPPAPAAPPPVVQLTKDLTLTVDYEKIEGTIENIFRYRLQITPNYRIAIEIDDVINGRSVRKEKSVNKHLIDELAEFFLDSGFYALDAEYRGVDPTVCDEKTISLTIGKQTHRVQVTNRAAPAIFQSVYERLESFGQVELGLWAIQFSTEKLTELANNALLEGRKLYGEREIQYGNLAAAVRSLKEAEWYLETVEPKPAFFGEILAARTASEEELDTRYEEQNFRAVRALQIPDWESAATELRIICELIPNREDERHEEARKKLLEVEARIRVRNE